jgi:hypothetical protein
MRRGETLQENVRRLLERGRLEWDDHPLGREKIPELHDPLARNAPLTSAP